MNPTVFPPLPPVPIVLLPVPYALAALLAAAPLVLVAAPLVFTAAPLVLAALVPWPGLPWPGLLSLGLLWPGVPVPGVSPPGVVAVGAVSTVVVAAVAGVLAGALVRRALARLRRGVAVPPPWCECALGLLWPGAVTAWAFGPAPPWVVPLLLVLAVVVVACSATDLLRRRLPNALTVPALPAVGLALAPAGGAALGRGTAGALLLGGAYAAVHLAAPAALGAGDVKLAVPVGAALAGVSWPALVAGLAATAAGSGLVAAGAVAAGRAGWGTRLPHGPVLLGAAWVTVLGSALVR